MGLLWLRFIPVALVFVLLLLLIPEDANGFPSGCCPTCCIMCCQQDSSRSEDVTSRPTVFPPGRDCDDDEEYERSDVGTRDDQHELDDCDASSPFRAIHKKPHRKKPGKRPKPGGKHRPPGRRPKPGKRPARPGQRPKPRPGKPGRPGNQPKPQKVGQEESGAAGEEPAEPAAEVEEEAAPPEEETPPEEDQEEAPPAEPEAEGDGADDGEEAAEE